MEGKNLAIADCRRDGQWAEWDVLKFSFFPECVAKGSR